MDDGCRQALRCEVERVPFALSLLESLQRRYHQFLTAGEGPSSKHGKPTLFGGQRIVVVRKDHATEGVAEDTDDHGALVVQLDGGTLRQA